jgi:hypothetical protein
LYFTAHNSSSEKIFDEEKIKAKSGIRSSEKEV